MKDWKGETQGRREGGRKEREMLRNERRKEGEECWRMRERRKEREVLRKEGRNERGAGCRGKGQKFSCEN